MTFQNFIVMDDLSSAAIDIYSRTPLEGSSCSAATPVMRPNFDQIMNFSIVFECICGHSSYKVIKITQNLEKNGGF